MIVKRRTRPSGYANNQTGYRGVHWEPEKERFRAEIYADGVRHRLGRFYSAEEAALAYDAAARRFFGDSAKLNFPFSGERAAGENA